MRAALVFVVVAACQPRTEIMIGIATDMHAPSGIDEVRLEVAHNGVTLQTPSWTVPGIPNADFTLPGSYGVVSDGSLPIDVSLIGLKGGTEIVRRDAKLSLVDGQTLFYRMGLSQTCKMNGVVCTDGQTCVEGRCEGPAIDPDKMPDYVPELVTTLTCESLVRYINTSNGQPMPYSEDAADCPYILCSEGTCLEIPPGAVLFRGVCNAVSSFALLIDGTEAGASLGFFRGTGTATTNEFSIPIDINGEIVNFTGTFAGDRAYALGISNSGSIRCDAYIGKPQRYCGSFMRTTTTMTGTTTMLAGRVAFVRQGDVLFGQYASEQATGFDYVGSFDGWPTSSVAATGEAFSMFWRNEAQAGVAVESGTASATLAGDKLTGSWTGTSGPLTIAGVFDADPSRCRATALPNCGGACNAAEACIKGVCVGTGMLRFTLEWDTATDIDLHVGVPGGGEISWMTPNVNTGTLDVDDQGEGHLVENVYFSSPAPGQYTVWANNYDGNEATSFTITVATPSGPVSTFTGMLGAAHEESMHFVYTR